MAPDPQALSRQAPQALARITPQPASALAPGSGGSAVPLTGRQKAAVIVRYLISGGGSLRLTGLPDQMQAALAEQMGRMRLVDRETLDSVVAEFESELESVGLTFPGGLEGTLSAMDGHLSPTAVSRLRRMANMAGRSDPWERLVALPPAQILKVIEAESAEVAAVVMSKLPVAAAAEILGQLPGERARRIAFAVSQTGNVDPETVRRIGAAILSQIDSQPPRAFERGPVERVGAILNVAQSATREEVLAGLEQEDTGFAAEVRRAIFTYAHIPQRIQPRDVPKVVRLVDQPTLVNAMAFSFGRAAEEAATEFLLGSMSQRMAQLIREEIAERGPVREKDAEAAMAAVISAIRQLQGAGELEFVDPAED
ncbi:flagellar motor switch protein FliG [Pseudogemmobacter sonorensis]|uniref:flagellar motor switch protein FliG n=1 Tax=Pseudogemmobacter sonorensis TaxID=2989681 RepID=UPI0036BCFD73